MRLGKLGIKNLLGLGAKEERSSLANPAEWLQNALGVQTKGEIKASQATSLLLPAVYRAVNLLSSTLATLPIHVYESESADSRQIDRSHPAYRILQKSPNNIMTPVTFRETMAARVFLKGNAYGKIESDSNAMPIGIIPFEVDTITPQLGEDGKLYYKHTSGRTYNDFEVLHLSGLGFDGIKGQSVISYAAQNMGISLAAQQYGNKFFANDTHLGTTLTTDQTLPEDYRKQLQDQLDNRAGMDNAKKNMVLSGGLKVDKNGVNPNEAQFLQTRQFGIEDVARWFGVQPHMLFDLKSSTNNNIEQQALEFAQYTIQPWAIRFEQEYDRKLLTYKQQINDTHSIKHNIDAILRADPKSRAALYQSGIQNGWYSINDVRGLENMNPIEGGDKHFLQVNMQDINAFGNTNEGNNGEGD